MSKIYEFFYRTHGVRRAEQINNPPINEIADLGVSRAGVYHYLPEDNVNKGIPTDHWGAQSAERLVVVEHVSELDAAATEGNPKVTSARASTEIRDYHKRHRKNKKVRDLESNAKDERTLVVYNYAILPDLYRYTKSFFSDYYEWKNIQTTLWSNVNKAVSKLPQRQQFISFTLPVPLPTLTVLRKAEKTLTREILETLRTNEDWFILEIWKWLGEDRSTSTLAKLEEKHLDRVNLIVIHENHWVLLNLGKLDVWRKALEDDEGRISPDVLQKRFLKLLTILFESSTPTGAVDEDRSEVVEDDSEADEEPRDDEGARTSTGDDDVKGILGDDDEEALERELDTVHEVEEEVIVGNVFEPEEVSIGDSVKERAAELVADGVISNREYLRYEQLAETQKELPNPYTGKGSVIEAGQISEEDLNIEVPDSYPDNPGVVDKSMLESRLAKFDEQYIGKVLPKDIINSVMRTDRAGVVVTDYEVEEKSDTANRYEVHTVRVNPVPGKPSTLRFRVPKIDEDGTFTANGIKYRMRKQRGDMPIRKVKPERVALTSYYGKVFVDRSSKVVHSYPIWLTRNIRKKGLDSEDGDVVDLHSAQSVHHELKIPRIYSTLGQEFQGFTASEIEFYFNYEKRHQHFGEEFVDKNEDDQLVVVGKRGEQAVLVGEDDTFYAFTEGKLDVLGKIEDLVNLDRSKAPTEVAELKVFSKSIPLAVVLSYYGGIDRLINSLPGDTRRVNKGDTLSLQENEFPIRFKDETLVVDREDKLTALILGGFNAYKNSIKNYNIDEFNKKDVFFNVLDDNGLGIYHLNEVRLLDQMFVDPITEELLKELEEPQTWRGLLRRAAELLLTDYAPQETDMEHMRIKGYERVAGAVYGEMINSLRGFNAKPQGKNSAVDMNPFAVWETINSDPAVVLVEESNPIQNLKEKESVTFMGTGGRGRTTMVERTRVFHPNDMGTISEATVDSGDVGINTSTVPNPKFINVRGVTKRYEDGEDGPTSLLSTSALLSPGADVDDPKRVNI